MRYILTLFLLALISTAAPAQLWQRVQQNPGKYFIGIGTGATVEEADKLALSELISQISVNVTVDNNITDRSVQQDGKITADNTLYQSSIRTYSTASLNNIERMVLSGDKDKEKKVARWIERAEIGKLAESRRNKIHGYIDAAMRAEEKGKIDVALRSYYWAFVLLRTMQYSNNEEYLGNVLITWLPECIVNILGDLSASVTSNDGNGNVDIKILYNGKPVPSIDYTYSDGGLWSNICSAKDGRGRLEITSTLPVQTYDINVEVEYRDQADLDPEINSVMAIVPEYSFKEGFIQIPCNITANDTPKQQTAAGSSVDFARSTIESTFTSVPEDELAAPPTIGPDKAERYNVILGRIEQAIRKAQPETVFDCFTPEGRDLFIRLIKYGKATIIGTPQYSFSAYKNYTWARGLAMNFKFRHGARRNFTEDIVFTFDSNDLICNVAFGLGDTATADILSDNAVPAEARMLLTDFMENYQTAFALKRLDYIESIFSEDALIIVVNKLQPTGSHEIRSGERYQSMTYDRAGYIKRLAEQFRYKEFINLRFNQTDLRRSSDNAKSTVYGIQIEQDYYSSNYSDHGYLFLLINLNDPEKPVIQVRTWQPEPDPEFGIYSLDDFHIQHTD